uniref:Tectonic-1-3 domain-containing protein n=1 Tax=Haptolina brevifila TaxID=156173 RepID=A0A7S2CJF3_9EUKA
MGACASGPDLGSAVLFGEAMAMTCTERISPNELRAFCVDVDPLEIALIAVLNLTSTTKVGIYGDSHPEMPEDWVSLEVRYPNNDQTRLRRSWDETRQICSNVLSGMSLRVLYSEVGSVNTPIAKVLGAELVFTSRSVSARRCALGVPCDTVISVTATTTFANLDTESFDFIPDSPTIIPPLPRDFFYPFFY